MEELVLRIKPNARLKETSHAPSFQRRDWFYSIKPNAPLKKLISHTLISGVLSACVFSHFSVRRKPSLCLSLCLSLIILTIQRTGVLNFALSSACSVRILCLSLSLRFPLSSACSRAESLSLLSASLSGNEIKNGNLGKGKQLESLLLHPKTDSNGGPTSESELKLLRAAIKLREGYEKAENLRKRKAIQIIDFQPPSEPKKMY